MLLLQVAGCDFGEPEDVEYGGVPLSMGPRVVMLPSFATSTQDLRRKAGPGVKVSSRRSDLYVYSTVLVFVMEVLLLVYLFCLAFFIFYGFVLVSRRGTTKIYLLHVEERRGEVGCNPIQVLYRMQVSPGGENALHRNT